MKNIKNLPTRPTLRGLVLALAVASGFLVASEICQAQTQAYSEDFDTDHTADWTANPYTASGGTVASDFFFDYSTVGIPSAPNSAGATTRGLKLACNTTSPGGFPNGLSVSPNGQNFFGDYEVRFDMWLNFLGPAPGATANHGTSKLSGGGIGTASALVQINAAPSIDSIFFACNGDGNGSTGDYRAWSPAGGLYAEGNAVYAAPGGTRNNTAAYYTAAFPGQPVPAAQTTLFPTTQTGTAQNGCQAWKWRDVSIKKFGNTVTWSIDGTLIATVDVTAAGTLGGNNILFCHSDINNIVATDPNGLTFALFDNIRVTNYSTSVSVSVPTPDASETGPTPGMFTVTRSTAGSPLTVNLSLTGTAANGVDYTNEFGAAIPSTITFAAADQTTNITIMPVDDTVAELTETVVLTLTSGAGYALGAPISGTVSITDNETPTIDLAPLYSTMYERLTNDYASFKLTRRGNLSPGSFNVNFSDSGPVGAYHPVGTVTFDDGVVTTNLHVHPIDNSTLDGPRSVTITIASGTGYAIGTNNPVAATIVDDETPPETVLWSDSLAQDSSANWNLLVGSTNSSTVVISTNWAYDYSALDGVPTAPHSTGDNTNGLKMTVNKTAGGGAAGLNFYPIGQSFSGNYALRFDMYLAVGQALFTTELAFCGINHDGLNTNWFKNSGVPAGWTFDGLWCWIEVDGAQQYSGGDYRLSGAATGTAPALLASQYATNWVATFKAPPWADYVSVPATYGYPGVPANVAGLTTTPSWADVEVSQIGKVVTLTINRTMILSYTNASGPVSGNIMLGYDDPADSVGPPASSVIYANARVISLASPVITKIVRNPPNAEITFTANSGDVTGQFALQSAPVVNGAYADTSSTISSLGGGAFKAVKAAGANEQFYRIRRIY